MAKIKDWWNSEGSETTGDMKRAVSVAIEKLRQNEEQFQEGKITENERDIGKQIIENGIRSVLSLPSSKGDFVILGGEVILQVAGIKFSLGSGRAAKSTLRTIEHKKVDYSSIVDPKNAGIGKEFTLKQKQAALELNRKANGGVVKSDLYGQILVKPQKSKKGVTPDPNEWQFDHIDPKSCSGTNCSSNLQILSRKQNRDKSNN